MPVGLFIALFGYLLGSVPTGLLLAKFFSKVDPRQMGSKNIGATNIFRTAGKGLGILTLVGDVLKGMIPIGIAIQLSISDLWLAAVGLSTFLGHIFPIFLGFRGGKGGAPALGVSLGSICCATTIPVLIAFFRSDSQAYFILSVIIAALILYRHQENIVRLLQGTENKWKT